MKRAILAAPLLLALACEGGDSETTTAGGGVPSTEAVCQEPGVICTYMGRGKAGLGHDGVAPAEVLLYLPQDLTFGPDGTPWVIDWNNHRIRVVRDGLVETAVGTGYLGDAPDGVAAETSLNHPTHVTFDSAGKVYVSAWHNSKVMRLDPASGKIEAICGTGARDYGGDGGPAKDAVLDLPVATVFDSKGRLLIMDQANQRVRRMEEDGTIVTVVGPDKDWLPASHQKVCATGDDGVETCKVCMAEAAADPACEPSKPPKPQGYAGDGGAALGAMMYQPFSQSAPPAGRMEMGPDDRLYFCDTGNHRIRMVDAAGTVTTVAGSGPDAYDPSYTGGYAGDGGQATEAELKRPTDVAVAPDGTLFIADTDNNCVRKVDPAGVISTVAGTCGKRGFEGDGGPASAALLDRPYGVALDGDGNLYVADTHNHRIRVVRAP
jgi:sugar lactone lactonase YvrE